MQMGEIVELPSNSSVCHGYLVTPPGTGPGVIVIQEWWGLVDHIKDVAERFAVEGFVALAPDLYHGKATKEPDEAGKLMMDLKLEAAARDLSGSVDFLLAHDKVQPKKVASVGFCMGGALSLVLATVKPIDACVTYYGLPSQTEPDYSKIKGPVLGHFADQDDWATPDAAKKFFARLGEMGIAAELHNYPATHAFFNETSHEEHPQRVGSHNEEAAKLSWERTLEFLRTNLK
jgi:carboxymethylenebutenolidase